MKLSCISFFSSAVLTVFLLQNVDAAKNPSGMTPITLSPTVVNALKAKTINVGSDQAKVLTILLAFYQKSPAVLDLLLNFYNSIKTGKIKNTTIPAEILSGMPIEIKTIICIEDGTKFKLNPTIFETLDLLRESIQEHVDAANSCSCKACCATFWCKQVPDFLMLTLELVGPFLLELTKDLLTIALTRASDEQPTQVLPVQVLVPNKVIIFQKLR